MLQNLLAAGDQRARAPNGPWPSLYAYSVSEKTECRRPGGREGDMPEARFPGTYLLGS